MVVPARHLVYAFTWGATTDLEVHTAGFAEDGINARTFGEPSGMSDSTGGTEDKGTITVNVIREQAPATPTSFATPNANMNPEEVELVRLLGPTFIDPRRSTRSSTGKCDKTPRLRHRFEFHDRFECQRPHEGRRVANRQRSGTAAIHERSERDDWLRP